MKNKNTSYSIFLLIAAAALLLGACRKDKIKPEQADTFIKYYGRGGTQTAGNVAITPDGGYILVGTTDSYGNGKDILVVKTDKFGNEQWNKVLGGAGDDEGKWIIVSNNGNFVLTGSKAEAGGVVKDVYVAELSPSGVIVGEKTYGTAGKNDYGNRIINTINAGYAIIGTSYDYNLAPSSVYLIKLNNNRDTMWTAKYGNLAVQNFGTGIQQYYDSVYITSAYTSTPDMLVTKGRLQKNPYAYKPNSNIGKEKANPNVINTTDILIDSLKFNNKYLLGSTSNNTIYIANIDNNENNVFYKELVTFPQSKASLFCRTYDNGFVIAGSILNGGSTDILVVRTDANANVIWSKTFGGSGNDYGTSVVQTNDGGFIVSGTISFGGNATGSNDVISLIRIDSNGELK